MKIRTGFVSNSSSSNFALIGVRIDLSETKDYRNDITAIGHYIYEGIDVFHLEKDMFVYIISTESEINYDLTYLKVLVESEDRTSILACDFKKRFEDIKDSECIETHSICADQHYTDSLECFIDRYGKELKD